MRQDARHFVPTCMTVAPCSEPSRPSLWVAAEGGQS
jgi:hypothetical protein